MPFVPSPNTAQVEMVFSQAGQIVENVYHVLHTEPYTAGSLATLGLTFYNWWNTDIKPLTCTDVSLTKIILSAMDTENSPSIEYTSNLPLAGTSANGNSLPNNVTAVVTWVTGLRGRSFRGRTYHVGLTDGQVTGSNLDAGTITALHSAYEGIITALTADGDALVVCSKISNGVARTACLLTEIATAAINQALDSQRRRLPGRGQ